MSMLRWLQKPFWMIPIVSAVLIMFTIGDAYWYSKATDYLSTNATVVDKKERKSASIKTDAKHYHLSVKYEPHNSVSNGDERLSWVRVSTSTYNKYQKGDDIKLYYYPQSPLNLSADEGTPKRKFIMFMISTLVLILWSLWFFSMHRKTIR